MSLEERGRFGFDGAEGHAFWVYSDATHEQAQATIEFSDLEDLKLFLQENLPGLLVDEQSQVNSHVGLILKGRDLARWHLRDHDSDLPELELTPAAQADLILALVQAVERLSTPPADDVRQALKAAIGYAPVKLSIRNHPEITYEYRTVEDRDGLVERILEAGFRQVRPRGTEIKD